MKLLNAWGFTADTWKGKRGEYWVVAQMLLLLGFVLVPQYRPGGLAAVPPGVLYGVRGVGAAIALFALILLSKGLLDLGQNLTPLPYPREDGELVQTGVYSIVRHSLYSGIILGTLGLSLWQLSVSHFVVTLALFWVLDIKAAKEEVWLQERYPDYADYRQRVKKLLPWIY